MRWRLIRMPWRPNDSFTLTFFPSPQSIVV
jgi:hypothetical protein